MRVGFGQLSPTKIEYPRSNQRLDDGKQFKLPEMTSDVNWVSREHVHKVLEETEGILMITHSAGDRNYQVNAFSSGQNRIDDMSEEAITALKKEYANKPFTVDRCLQFLSDMTAYGIANGSSVGRFIRGYDSYVAMDRGIYSASGTHEGVENYTTIDEWINHFESRKDLFSYAPNSTVISNPLLAEVTGTQGANEHYSFSDLLRILK